MLFEIQNGIPYLISHGRACPVEIKDGAVIYDKKHATMTEDTGRYTLQEVIAKCGNNVSSIPTQKRNRRKAESE